MDQRAIVDVICKAAMENLAGEIGALLGQELSCSEIQLHLTSKDSFFSAIERDKIAFTRMAVTGDRQGGSYLLTRLDTAAVLGGTLIMLPADMIEEQAQSGKLDGELADAFGEVANIVAGVFTQTFVDRYAKALRFIKESVEELVPTKIDLTGEQPFPPGNYHVSSCLLSMGGTDLGRVEFVVPAAIFDLQEDAAETTGPEPAAPQDAAQTETADEPASPAAKPEPAATWPAPAPEPEPAFTDTKKLTDTIFKATIAQVGEEIGALIGRPLSCDDLTLEMTSKVDFFANHCLEKSVLTQLQISGDREGTGFLAIRVADAIVLGGTLIMLPEDQIAEQAQKGGYEGETEDAFGEVVNILAGSLTQVFLERYPKQLRFIKTDSELIVPTKVDAASDHPFPAGDYYLVSFAIATEGYELERMRLLFPAEVFDLGSHQTAVVQAATTASETTAAPAVQEKSRAGTPVALIITEQPDDAAPFADILSSVDYEAKILTYQDDIKAICQQHRVLGVFLLMAQVSEKGFATAIKLQSAGRPLPPMIFAGPEWTRSAVLRAVKYGARDILVLPASREEIQEKITQHMFKAS